MDNKRLIIGMAVALAILLGWNYFIAYVGKVQNWKTTPDKPQTEQVQAAPVAGGPETATVKATGEAPATGTTTGAAAMKGLRVIGSPAASTATLGSVEERNEQYSLGIRTQSKGASILAVTLNRFPKSLDKKAGPYVFQQPASSGTASMATLTATVNGQTVKLDDVQWKLVQADTQSAEYEVELGGDRPLLVIQKRIEIKPRSDAKTGGYEVLVRHRIVRSASGEAVKVALSMAGPTTPPREVDRGPDRYVLTGYNDLPDYSTIKPESVAIESLKEPKNLEKAGKDWQMIWTGLTSTYFDALVFPVAQDTHHIAPFIDTVQARPMNAGKPNVDVEMTINTKPVSLDSGNTSVDLDMLAFFGPKERAVLKNSYYGIYPRQYDTSLTTTGSCGWCTFQWLVDWMVWLLVAFHAVLRDWGLAIIGLVVLVRALMHPLTRKSTISMHKMSKLAPEIERIKKKYADDPTEQQKAMMAFYKEHGAGQVLGCLPMFIQMPIWIALWSSLQSTFELRLAPFLWGFTWIKDLSKPDHLITFPGINLFFFELNAINILPISMAVVFYLQQKFTPQAAAATPEQEQQQKMMKWMMTLMFPIMLYNGPSGLNLYIFTSTLVGIMESKWIRDHIKAREAAQAAAGPVIIDAPATRAARHRQGNAAAIEKPKSRFAQWWENIQKMAADVQKQQDRRKK